MASSGRVHVDDMTEAEARTALEMFSEALGNNNTPSHKRRKIESLTCKFENALRSHVMSKLERQRAIHAAQMDTLREQTQKRLAAERVDAHAEHGGCGRRSDDDGDDSSMPDNRTY